MCFLIKLIVLVDNKTTIRNKITNTETKLTYIYLHCDKNLYNNNPANTPMQ